MIITIDTNEQLTPKQKVSIAALLDFPGTDEWAQQLENGTDTSAKPKTTRTRRTKAQMEAAEAERPIREETKAQNAASEAEQTETPKAEQTDQELTDALDTEASIERLTEVATELVTKDRQAMIELLERYGAKRASQVPADKRGELIVAIESELERLEAEAAKA